MFPNPIKITASFLKAKQNCADFDRFLENIRLGKWIEVENQIAADNTMIAVKDKKLFYLSSDYTKRFTKARVKFWRTFDDCLSKYQHNEKENRVIFSAYSHADYAVFNDERKLRHLKIP